MLNSVMKLSRVGTGFAADHLLTTRIALTRIELRAARGRASHSPPELLARALGDPACAMRALTSTLPFGGTRGANGIDIEGRPQQAGELRIVDQRHVSPGYFQTMRIPLLRGRTFNDSDDSRGGARSS